MWGIFAGCALLGLAVAFAANRILETRPDCYLDVQEKECTNFCYSIQPNGELFLTFSGKVKNLSSKEQAIITDASITIEPDDILENGEVWAQLRNLSIESPPLNYWKAFMLKPSAELNYQASILIKGFSTEHFPFKEQLRISLSFQYYGKNLIKWKRASFIFPRTLWQEKNNPPLATPKTNLKTIKVNGNLEVCPIRTRLLRPGDDMAEIIETYVKHLATPGDIVAIAESAMAIVQGRLQHILDIKPGFWAKRLNKFFHFNSSLGSVYSMQMAIQEVGLPRMLTGIIFGILGRLIGRKGDFYRITGRKTAMIDDCAGTMPPFDKFVVLGPEAPLETARQLKKQTGLEIAIVDVNDLQRVDILGASDGIISSELISALRDNPQGNDNEQTPLVLIKKEPFLR